MIVSWEGQNWSHHVRAYCHSLSLLKDSVSLDEDEGQSPVASSIHQVEGSRVIRKKANGGQESWGSASESREERRITSHAAKRKVTMV